MIFGRPVGAQIQASEKSINFGPPQVSPKSLISWFLLTLHYFLWFFLWVLLFFIYYFGYFLNDFECSHSYDAEWTTSYDVTCTHLYEFEWAADFLGRAVFSWLEFPATNGFFEYPHFSRI